MERLPFVYGAHAFEVKDINAVRREVTHLVSTNDPDRIGDVIDPKGWVLDNYLKNPVVLVDHDYRVEKIIGSASNLFTDDRGLYATTRFHDKGLGAEAFELVNAGIAKAWSVGFRPIESEPLEGKRGYHFTKHELLEYSLVAIPMNPEAVNNAIRCGVSSQSIALLFKAPAPAAAAHEGANGARRPTWKSVADMVARLARNAEIKRRAEEL